MHEMFVYKQNLRSFMKVSPRKVNTSINLVLENFCQKPSQPPKSKDHHAALESRLKLWEKRKIEELLYEGQTIQRRLKSHDSSMTITKILIAKIT